MEQGSEGRAPPPISTHLWGLQLNTEGRGPRAAIVSFLVLIVLSGVFCLSCDLPYVFVHR